MKEHKDFRSYFICAVPVAIIIAYWFIRPFQDVAGEAKRQISHLSGAQKINIQLAAHKIDGVVIRPGETFSFNREVGPRTVARGFVSAPTYLDGTTAMTDGGGVCLVSSMLYEAALESGLRIVSRTPHSRTTTSVLPGLDATVSYDRIDLKFANDSNEPILIKSACDPNRISVSIHGNFDQEPVRLVRREERSGNQLKVELLRVEGEKLVRLSNSIYRIR
ncbi:MAG: VanW family protein [Cyanobacteria bacterium]|nr:VanW family protein [Cyanobacteriota bacterium]